MNVWCEFSLLPTVCLSTIGWTVSHVTDARGSQLWSVRVGRHPSPLGGGEAVTSPRSLFYSRTGDIACSWSIWKSLVTFSELDRCVLESQVQLSPEICPPSVFAGNGSLCVVRGGVGGWS